MDPPSLRMASHGFGRLRAPKDPRVARPTNDLTFGDQASDGPARHAGYPLGNARICRCPIDAQLRAGTLCAFQVRSVKEHLIL